MSNVFINNPLVTITIIISLFGILAGHRLLLYRDRKKRRDDAVGELRNLLNQTFIEATDRRMPMGNMIGMQKQSVLNFRPFLSKKEVRKYNDACEKYYENYKMWESNGVPHRQTLIACINDLMRFLK